MALPEGITPINTKGWPETEGWNLVRYMVDACHDLGVPELIDEITIEFSTGMRKSVGKAFPARRYILLSRYYWAYLPESEKRDTIIHEVCHIVNPGADHGRAWKDAMVRCGVEPEKALKLAMSILVKRKHTARHTDKLKLWEIDQAFHWRYDAGKCPECDKPMWWRACDNSSPITDIEGYYRISHLNVGECSYGDAFWDQNYKWENRENMTRDKNSAYYRYGRPETRAYVRTIDNWRGWKLEGD